MTTAQLLQKLMTFKAAHGMWLAKRINHRMLGIAFSDREPKIQDYTS